jgi:protein SCO1
MRDVVAALLLVYAVAVAEASTRWLPRASWPLRAPRVGIAAWQAAALSITTSTVAAGLANLMGLSPVPARLAPGFKLTDQDGRSLPLPRFRGKVVVLEFMDPHCTDICPIVSQEFIDAYHDLGHAAGDVVFAAVNVNLYHARVLDVRAFSAEHQLTTIPGWHFFTGPPAALRAVWRDYGIQVLAPSPDADVVHTSTIYFIAPDGTERYVAAPMDDKTQNGTAYLPSGQLADWGRGIALVARDLTR